MHTIRVARGAVAALVVVVMLGAVPPLGAAGDATLPLPGAPPTMQAGDRWFPRDEQGRAFVLHGYNIKLHGNRLHEVTPSVLGQMRANGFTVVRLATFWTDLEPTQDVWNETYLTDLARILADADAVGLKVVLTMHQDSYSEAVGGYGMPGWTTRTDGITYNDNAIPCLEPANQRAWEHFWEDADLQQEHVDAWAKIVDELGDAPALYGYDLLNEPCGEVRPGEGFVEALTRVEAEQITPMLQRVTDTIRSRDTERWIFLEGAFALTSSLGGAGGLGTIDDPTGRQIHAPHLYDVAMEAGADWNPSSPFVENYYATIGDYGTDHEIPTVLFEWGPQFPTFPNTVDYVHRVLEGADDHLAGWSAFAWVKGLWSWSQLDADGNPGAGMTDTVHTYPMNVAGRPMDIDSDPTRGRSSVTVDPAGAGASGPTTFYFPMRRFPTGPQVSVDLPADRWSWTFDEATQTVSVTVAGDERHTITVAPVGVELTKTGDDPVDVDGDGLIGAGDTIDFTFAVRNRLDRTIGQPSIADPLIPDVTCPGGDLAGGAAVTCTGTYVLTDDDARAGSVTNTATVEAADGDDVLTASDETTVGWDRAEVALEKVARLADGDGDGRADVGEAVEYTFTVTNPGTVELSDLAVDDPMVGAVTCTATTLEPGGSTTCTAAEHVVTDADVADDELVNVATATVQAGAATLEVTASVAIPTDPGDPTTSTSTSTTSTAVPSTDPSPGGPQPGGTPGSSAGAGRDALPRTGASIATLAGIAAALLAAGFLTITAARRRRLA